MNILVYFGSYPAPHCAAKTVVVLLLFFCQIYTFNNKQLSVKYVSVISAGTTISSGIHTFLRNHQIQTR